MTLSVWPRAIAALGAAAALAWFAWLISEPRNPALPDPARQDQGTAQERATAAAAIRIEAESRNNLPAPAIVSAPRGRPASPMDVPDVGASRLPDGYAFVSHRGEMTRAPLDGPAPVRLDDDESLPYWIDSPNAVQTLVDQAARAGRDWSFGWIRLAGGSAAEDLRGDLRRLGGEVLGSAGRLVRARLPGDADRLGSLLALDGVGGLGAVPAELKLPEAYERGAAHEELPVFITLMTDDPDGRWRRELESMGAAVGRFDADTRAYAANVTHGALDALVQADFVLAVEPVRPVEAAHDTAVPALGADALRTYRSPGIFSGGGASVPIGVMDSGLNVNHPDIASNRDSICGANFVSANRRLEHLDLWVDSNGHGTHVTGTFAGNGFVDPRLAGVAPSVRDIRFAKALDEFGSGDTDSVVRAMDFLSMPTACDAAGRSGVPVRPLIVNASLSMSGVAFAGRGAGQRKLDAMVWGHRQLYVVAQGNENEIGFANLSAAKNSLAVGAVRDGGILAPFSSRGPTADGRLAPQIVATGVDIRSPAGAGSRGDYRSASGTSSAAPAVAGIAALLMDAEPQFRRQPALTRARLMASAVKPDPWFDAPGRFPASNTAGPGDLQSRYGLGRASARTGVLDRPGADGWTNGSATTGLEDGEYAYEDIELPQGASRLDLVLTWDEPPADTISAAVLNDLDLWLDRDGDCGAAACGEYSSLSRKDNVEWIVVRDPPPGVYRAKVTPQRVYAAAPRAALAWTVIRGASTPTLQMEPDRDRVPAGNTRLKLTLKSDAYVAAGTRLRVDCRAADGSSCTNVLLHGLRVGREDAAPVRGSGPDWLLGTHLALGEIGAGEAQEVEFFLEYEGKGGGAVRLYFTATAWNANAAAVTVKAGIADVEVAAVPAPDNDDFARALAIPGASGSVDLDLASATAQAGEPPVVQAPATGAAFGSDPPPDAGPAFYDPPRGRPAGSVWYDWTAPADGHFRFNPGGQASRAEPVYVDVYTGNDIAGLHLIESNVAGGGDFYAQAGQVYRVRVSNGTDRDAVYGQSTPLTLGWSTVERPANDDLDFGAVIEGDEGRFAGNNVGATLQSGEWFGGLASTVWHRWTAPRDGAVRFDSSAGFVMAFAGEDLAALRLVSGRPDGKAEFSVVGAADYRIAIAAQSAFAAGAPYELDWRYVDREAGNDDFGGAEEIGAEASSHYVYVDGDSTVQPGEPPETGVRTNWWVWTAPQSATYTWRLDDRTLSPMRISAFSGGSLDSLRLEGTTGSAVASFEFTLAAVEDRRYFISAGLPNGDFSAFAADRLEGPLAWGLTPANDGPGGAAVLSGADGSAMGSNAFATVDPGERIRGLGHSSLWWTYEAPAAGWYRFDVQDAGLPFVLGVYEVAADGSLRLLGVSRRPASPSGAGQPSSITPEQLPDPTAPAIAAELIFRADPATRYLIRLGAMSEGPGGEFTLRWEETAAPVWLKYLGYLAGGDADPAGNYVDPDLLDGLSGLAMDGGGTLYAAGSNGLVAFERDPDSGALSLSQTLNRDWSGVPRRLFFDEHRNRLYAQGCIASDVFSTDGTGLRDEGLDEAGTAICGDGRAFMDSGGSSMYVVIRATGLAVLRFGEHGGLRYENTVEIPGVTDAVIANGDAHVYAIADGSLVVFERDGETGSLREAGSLELSEHFTDSGFGGVAISHDDAHLIAVSDSELGNAAAIFGLSADPANPARLHTLLLDGHVDRFGALGCRLAGPRSATSGFDLFCHGATFGLQWDAQSETLKLTDVVQRVDRFNNAVPRFDIPRGLALSPDGRHAYLATQSSGILFFERVGNFE